MEGDLPEPLLCFVAKRLIEAGEFLSFHCHCTAGTWPFQCNCGAATCVYASGSGRKRKQSKPNRMAKPKATMMRGAKRTKGSERIAGGPQPSLQCWSCHTLTKEGTSVLLAKVLQHAAAKSKTKARSTSTDSTQKAL
eukprot:130903-Rhodomonas_salina.1